MTKSATEAALAALLQLQKTLCARRWTAAVPPSTRDQNRRMLATPPRQTTVVTIVSTTRPGHTWPWWCASDQAGNGGWLSPARLKDVPQAVTVLGIFEGLR